MSLRWKDVENELAGAGVDPETAAALAGGFGDAPHRLGKTRVLVASAGRLDLATSLPEPPPAELVRVGPLPALLPLLRGLQASVPHLVVLTDRQGADILRHRGAGAPEDREVVDSDQWPVHKTGTGGWAALRYEHAVEESWKASEREVAEAVTKAADEVHAELVLVAGDVHAVQGLRAELPERLRHRVVEIEGSRAVDGSEQLLQERVREAVEDHLDAQTADLLSDFVKYRNRATKLAEGEQLGNPDEPVAANAADGPWPVTEALRQAQVGTLLLTDELDQHAIAWFGPEPTDVAMQEQTLLDLGVGDVRQAPLVDVLLRAALGTDAQVRLVSYDKQYAPLDGVGALLRFSTPA
jgi:hypothetical protein